jgi:hypothetical protein
MCQYLEDLYNPVSQYLANDWHNISILSSSVFYSYNKNPEIRETVLFWLLILEAEKFKSIAWVSATWLPLMAEHQKTRK